MNEEGWMGPAGVLRTAALAFIIVATAGRTARADESIEPRALPAPHSLGLFAGVGALGSPGASGGAFLTGLRLGLGRHFAASVDLGYGLLTAPPTIQDRWWVIPSAALVIPGGSVRFDLGAGAGVGTSSGYVSWSDYDARPFTPIWHYTVPAVRAHALAAIEVAHDLDLFARVDVASLLSVGSQAGATDTTWFALFIGVEPRLL
jgi:hypothetical protein